MLTAPAIRTVARRLCVLAVAAAAVPFIASSAHAQPAPAGDVGSNGTPDIPNSAFVFAGQVNAENTIVRSGPSENDYPVMKIPAGTLLNVVAKRDDWLKIEPPAGSFCLVSQAIVDKGGDGTSGRIVLNTAVVRVGSQLVPQRMTRTPISLPVGSTVKIIGEAQNEWYKIEPPPGVYFYVQSRFVTPMQRVGEQPNANGGVHTPGGTTPPGTQAPTAPTPAPLDDSTNSGGTVTPIDNVTPPTTNGSHVDANNRFIVVSDGRGAAGGGVSVPLAAPSTQPVDVTAIRALQERLTQLEQQYVAASTKPLQDQPLDELASGYGALLADQNLPPNARHVAEIRSQTVQLRKETLASYQQTQQTQERAAQRQRELEAEQRELAQRAEQTAVKRYAAIGRLAQSSLQLDGQPLYRLIDPSTNRTIIYVRTPVGENAVAIAGGLNQFIAINGEVVNDDSKRLTYITPKAYDVVDPKQVNTRLFADYSPPSLTATNVAGTGDAQ